MTVTLRDCTYGQAIGDALGVPYEFMARGSFECTGMVGHGTHDQPSGTWSDDTSMALAICDGCRELGRIDVADIREKFLAWYRSDAYTCDHLFDIGNATAAVAGALAGIVYGYEGIPGEWIDALRGRDVVDACLF